MLTEELVSGKYGIIKLFTQSYKMKSTKWDDMLFTYKTDTTRMKNGWECGSMWLTITLHWEHLNFESN